MMIAIAMVHVDSRRAVAIAMGLLYDQGGGVLPADPRPRPPFTGEISIAPAPLLQVEIVSTQE